MTEHTAQLNMLWGKLVMEELHRLGVRDVCIAPGSRSTPLTLNAADHEGLSKHIHFDERGLGYFALGLAKATQRPVALICSSGTAAANFFPAVVEAGLDSVPLIVLTADRPDELHFVGANQSIDQNHLFGSHVVAYRQLAPSEGCPVESVLQTVDDVVAASSTGPVHVNCMFREPFVPETRIEPKSIDALRVWCEGTAPFTQYVTTVPTASLDDIVSSIEKAARGILIVGRLNSDADIMAAEALAEKLQWPTLADIGSGIRLGTDRDWLIPHFDMVLETCDVPEPDFFLYVGGPFTSKILLSYLKTHSEIPLLQVSRRQSVNPSHRPMTHVATDIANLTGAVETGSGVDAAFAEAWKEHNHQCGLVIKTDTVKVLNGACVARTVSEGIGDNHAVFIGNSLSVREMDRYASETGARPSVCLNRGASGIDGNIATAAGFATGKQVPLTIVIGDLTALHDLNSLSLIKSLEQDVVLVIQNNDGGGIFRKLPIAQQTEHFTEYFVTPHGYSFSSIAAMFGLEYHSPRTPAALEKAYKTTLEGGKHLIEVAL